MFFSLTKVGGDGLPVLNFYGKYSIDVLPKMTNRDSGLTPDEPIDQEKVARLLRAIHLFVKADLGE